MERAELDRYAGTDSDERRERSFVEGEWAFFLVDCFGRSEGVWVLGCGLEADFDYVEGLTWRC